VAPLNLTLLQVLSLVGFSLVMFPSQYFVVDTGASVGIAPGLVKAVGIIVIVLDMGIVLLMLAIITHLCRHHIKRCVDGGNAAGGMHLPKVTWLQAMCEDLPRS
jgi:hypothetical protein